MKKRILGRGKLKVSRPITQKMTAKTAIRRFQKLVNAWDDFRMTAEEADRAWNGWDAERESFLSEPTTRDGIWKRLMDQIHK